MAAFGKPEHVVSAEDVRTVQFDRHRPGYHMEQVDQFLDHVADTLEWVVQQDAGAPAPQPAPTIAEPRLYDPDDAAVRLMAATQAVVDKMKHDASVECSSARASADEYAVSLRGEADAYDTSTRSEADAYAERVKTQADQHADTVKKATADEARRMAEEARSKLIDEMRTLEGTRQQLLADNEALQQHLDTEKQRLGSILEALTTTVTAADLQLTSQPEISGATVDAILPELEPIESAQLVDDDTGPATEAMAAVDADLLDDDGTDDLLADEVESLNAALEDDEDDEDADSTPEVPLVAPPVATERIDDDELRVADDEEMEAAARSVFDLDTDDDDEVDISGDGLFGEDEVIDLDAEPQWSDAEPAEDRFFSEMRDAEDDDDFGPLDDRTETAMTAFFNDEEDART